MIKRAPRAEQFTVLNTNTLNLQMSPEELGVYLHLLSKPDDWSVNGVYLIKHFGMSKDKCYRILDRLAGREFNGVRLIEKQQERNDAGQFITTYTVQEPPSQSCISGPDQSCFSGPDRSCFTGPVNQDVLSIEYLNNRERPINAKTATDWMPTQSTLEAIQHFAPTASSQQITDAVIAFRPEIDDLVQKGFNSVNLNKRFLRTLREQINNAKSQRDGSKSIDERLADTSWAEGIT